MENQKVTNQIEVTDRTGKVGKIEEIDITELGYVKVKVWFPEERRWISYVDVRGLESLISGCNLKLNKEATV